MRLNGDHLHNQVLFRIGGHLRDLLKLRLTVLGAVPKALGIHQILGEILISVVSACVIGVISVNNLVISKGKTAFSNSAFKVLLNSK